MIRFDATPRPQLLPLQMLARDIEAWLLEREPTASGRWDEMGKDEFARSFTAARTAGTDIADDLYYALVDNVSRNGSEKDFGDLVLPILRQKGWLGSDRERAVRVALIYDTNLRLARASGRFQRYWTTRNAFPYLRAFTAGDERVRHPPKSPHSDHRAWNGIILPIEHPFWRKYWTPLGFRCRCGLVQMTRSQLARYKGGVTSEAELAERERELGEPFFISPAASLQTRMEDMAASTNERLMPGMPPVNTESTTQAGLAAWEAIINSGIVDDVARDILKLFG